MQTITWFGVTLKLKGDQCENRELQDRIITAIGELAIPEIVEVIAEDVEIDDDEIDDDDC